MLVGVGKCWNRKDAIKKQIEKKDKDQGMQIRKIKIRVWKLERKKYN